MTHDDTDFQLEEGSKLTKLSKGEPHKKSVTKINILDDGESSVHVHYPPMNPVAKTKAKVNPIKKPERRKSLDVAALMTKAEQASIQLFMALGSDGSSTFHAGLNEIEIKTLHAREITRA